MAEGLQPVQRLGGLAKLAPHGKRTPHDRVGDRVGVYLVLGVADTSFQGVELHLFHCLHATLRGTT